MVIRRIANQKSELQRFVRIKTFLNKKLKIIDYLSPPSTMGRLLFSLQLEAAANQNNESNTTAVEAGPRVPLWLADVREQMYLIRTFVMMNRGMEVTEEGRRLYMVFFEAERGYLRGNTVDEEKIKAAIEAAWLLPQESIFKMWDSEQAEQITNEGDTEPNSENEDYWVANYSDTSSNDGGDHMATR